MQMGSPPIPQKKEKKRKKGHGPWFIPILNSGLLHCFRPKWNRIQVEDHIVHNCMPIPKNSEWHKRHLYEIDVPFSAFFFFFRLVTNDFLNHERYKRKKIPLKEQTKGSYNKKAFYHRPKAHFRHLRRHINLFSRNSRPFSLSPSSFSLCFHSTSTSLLSLWRPLRQFLSFPFNDRQCFRSLVLSELDV